MTGSTFVGSVITELSRRTGITNSFAILRKVAFRLAL
jgi:hypothetical protein